MFWFFGQKATWDLSLLREHVISIPCIGRWSSSPLDHQGSLQISFFSNMKTEPDNFRVEKLLLSEDESQMRVFSEINS